MDVATVSFKWNESFGKKVNDSANIALLKMGMDIRKRAIQRAPVVTGALRNSIRGPYHTDTGEYTITAGGSSANGIVRTKSKVYTIERYVDYADKREKGPNRNPATEHYMERAKDDIMSGNWIQQYFGSLI